MCIRDSAKAAHEKGLNVWTYTGYTFEALLEMAKANEDVSALLQESDVLDVYKRQPKKVLK